MASKYKRQRLEQGNNSLKKIRVISVVLIFIKLLIIWRITNLQISQAQGHIWLGADGENYLKGVDGLISEGPFSTADILNYWPAGYPLIIYVMTFLGKSWALTLLSVVQSVVFAYATYIFARELQISRLRIFTLFSFLIISLNPTLSLNSMAVGYESLVASGFLMIIALIMRDLRFKNRIQSIRNLIGISLILSLISFMQPRFLFTAGVVLVSWIFFRIRNNYFRIFQALLISIVIVLLLPSMLIFRNDIATNLPVISTNLGVTMNIGAGETTGGYVKNPPGVPCNTTSTKKNEIDNQKVLCVINWYLNNPTKALKLFYNKSIYFWSPWFGPEANGTMARNPWLTIHPFKDMTKTQDGINLLYGNFGKLISWLWLLGGILFLILGFWILYKERGEIRLISTIVLSIVVCSWLVTLISIGDHRFRLPIMTASLFLQAVGIKTLFARGKSQIVVPLK
jgi:hypothetical protein